VRLAYVTSKEFYSLRKNFGCGTQIFSHLSFKLGSVSSCLVSIYTRHKILGNYETILSIHKSTAKKFFAVGKGNFIN